jgi:dephospho-CoA kinase
MNEFKLGNYTIGNNGSIQDLGKEVERVLQFIK